MIRGPLRRWSHLMQSLAVCRRGNVMMIFALAGVMLIISLGVAVDMWRAYTVKTRLQAALDSAGLAVASSDLAAMTPDAINTRLQAFFNVNYPSHGVLGTPSPPVYNTTDNNNIVTVSASASVPTTFMNIVGISTMSVAASAQVTIGAPNIDFYLLLDSSPSMLLGATSSDIAKLQAATPQQDAPYGCAFACHESHPTSGEVAGNPNGEDNYTLARNLGLTLRIDNEAAAASQLMTTATNKEQQNNAIYRMAIYSFDAAFNKMQTLTTNLTAAGTVAAGLTVPEMWSNNYYPGSTNHNNDQMTVMETALTDMNSTEMPNPGNGTNAAGDKPQEILFIVSDGVMDQTKNGSRYISGVDTSLCSTIKNRGIRIAFLYTVYQSITGDSWTTTNGNTYSPPNASPANSKLSGTAALITQTDSTDPTTSMVGSAAQACASPGLFKAVTSDQDITAALADLFIQAVNTAYLSR